jgi:[ribosomal protein S5]-alanine N-acetyltransferase
MFNRNDLRLRSSRLELIAATLELTKMELHSVSDLANTLGCAVPASWPPPLNDDESQHWYLQMLERDPGAAGWALWYIVRDESGMPRQLIGSAGFKGRPKDGICEIGYSLLSMHQGLGYATEAAGLLIGWAFEHSEVTSAVAETFPDLTASIRVMEKCGMRFLGNGNPEQGQPTVRYQVTRYR